MFKSLRHAPTHWKKEKKQTKQNEWPCHIQSYDREKE